MNKDHIDPFNKRVDKVEHVWCGSEDRWVYIEYCDQRKIIGLNFMQGDEYDLFKKDYCRSDKGLMEFYEQMFNIFPIEKASVSTINFINSCMWAFHCAIASRARFTN